MNKKYIAYCLTGMTAIVIYYGFMIAHKSMPTQDGVSSQQETLSAQKNDMNSTGDAYTFTEASKHIGQQISITGTPLKVYRSRTGIVFFDYCENYKDCPFNAVIFSADAYKFGDVSKYQGQKITLTGVVRSYKGKAGMILKNVEQIRE